jgi:hypothetical protein
MVFTVAFRLNGHRQAGSPSLSDMKGELVGLRDQAALMLVELPKRGRNRTSLFLRNLWLAARKHGGKLTYDPKTERGTLTEVIEFFSELNGVNTKLSPSTLDRIGKAVRRQTLTEVTEFFTIVDSIDRPD